MADMTAKSLNGERPRPLSAATWQKLQSLADGIPIQRFPIHPGINICLEREGLTEVVLLPDPGRGRRKAPHVQITDKGRARLRSGQA
jgi:hypothetical protein